MAGKEKREGDVSKRLGLRAWLRMIRAGLVPGWRRRKRVTLARAGVILAMYAAWIGEIALTHNAPAGENPWGYYVEQTLWYGAPVLVYAFTVGLVIDHFAARWGQAATLGCHALGVVAFMPVMLVIALEDPGFVYEGGIQSLGVFLVWPIQIGCEAMVGYLLAWVIPNSYPRQYWILRRIGRFVRHPVRTVRRYVDGTPTNPAPRPSLDEGTDWL